VTEAEQETRLACVDLLLEWSGPTDQTTRTAEKLDIAAVDEVS